MANGDNPIVRKNFWFTWFSANSKIIGRKKSLYQVEKCNFITPIQNLIMPFTALLLLAAVLVITYFSNRILDNTGRLLSPHYLFFLLGVAISASMVMDGTSVDKGSTLFVLYPYGLFTLFIMGPGLYLDATRKAGYKPLALLHYVPAFLILVTTLLHPLRSNQSIRLIQSLFIYGDTSVITSTGLFPDAYLFIAYPIYTTVYIAFTLYHAYRDHDNSFPSINNEPLLYGLLLISPMVLDMAHHFIYGKGLIVHSLNIVLFILFGILPLIALDISRKLNDITTVKSISKSIQGKQKNMDPISRFIAREINRGNKSIFTQAKFNKALLYSESGFPVSQWEKYYHKNHGGFSELKKFVRIKIALELINSGYLDLYSIEALSNEIGYKSRTSFYSAFEQVQNQSFPEFFKQLKS